MIEKISIKNFKSHADTTIELGRVTALVGPNGCGKTSVLQAIEYWNRVGQQVVHGAQLDPANLRSQIRRGQSSISISISGNPDDWETAISLTTADGLEGLWRIGQVAWRGRPGTRYEPNPQAESFQVTRSSQPIDEEVCGLFGKAFYFKGIASQLALPSTPLVIPPKLETDGEGLASVLANLMTSDRRRREQIERNLCAIAPTVKEVNARPVTLKRKEKKMFAVNGAQVPYEEERDVPGNELIFNTASGNEIPARDMSEGTLLTLGLLTLLHSSAEDVRLFLLDDIEQGLHPLAQRKLMQTLKDFAEKHDRQIILTTHSPYIVDELTAKDVWVMATDSEGISHCQQLSKGPNAEFALKVLTTGEFLGAEGEDWVLDQPPQRVQPEPAHA